VVDLSLIHAVPLPRDDGEVVEGDRRKHPAIAPHWKGVGLRRRVHFAGRPDTFVSCSRILCHGHLTRRNTRANKLFTTREHACHFPFDGFYLAIFIKKSLLLPRRRYRTI